MFCKCFAQYLHSYIFKNWTNSFIIYIKIFEKRKFCVSRGMTLCFWTPLLNISVRWPKRSNAVYPEFLLTNYQHIQLQEYCRLLDWCAPGRSGRHFWLAQAFLALGENEKALDSFLEASDGTYIAQNMERLICSLC